MWGRRERSARDSAKMASATWLGTPPFLASASIQIYGRQIRAQRPVVVVLVASAVALFAVAFPRALPARSSCPFSGNHHIGSVRLCARAPQFTTLIGNTLFPDALGEHLARHSMGCRVARDAVDERAFQAHPPIAIHILRCALDRNGPTLHLPEEPLDPVDSAGVVPPTYASVCGGHTFIHPVRLATGRRA